jgi:hypothetical protein
MIGRPGSALDLQAGVFEVELALEGAEDRVVDLAIVPHVGQL